jgi:ABC-2 type transport system ATP-binding protein
MLFHGIIKRMHDDILIIDSLVKKYGEKTAVDGLSLTIKRGDFYGFLGPNGAGKSSTIGCIIGTNRITEGSVVVNGDDVVKDYRAARKHIGVSAQEYNVDFFASVEDLIDFMGGYYGVPNPERKERLEKLLTRFGLQEHRKKAFRELSGGLKRRAILARALIHDPVLLILDEPTAGIDVEQRHELWKYLQALNEEGKTIILTSHYLEEVELLCRHISIINKGKLVATGTKEEFLKDGRSLEKRYLEITQGETY